MILPGEGPVLEEQDERPKLETADEVFMADEVMPNRRGRCGGLLFQQDFRRAPLGRKIAKKRGSGRCVGVNNPTRPSRPR